MPRGIVGRSPGLSFVIHVPGRTFPEFGISTNCKGDCKGELAVKGLDEYGRLTEYGDLCLPAAEPARSVREPLSRDPLLPGRALLLAERSTNLSVSESVSNWPWAGLPSADLRASRGTLPLLLLTPGEVDSVRFAPPKAIVAVWRVPLER